jgi:RHS repeat-associated protein
VNGTITLFVYDEQGKLTGEYDATGQLLQEIIWFGDLPVAVLRPTAPQSPTVDIFYVHADHQATPRKITRATDNKVVWMWESEAFGNNLPNQNPSNLGEFVFNLRFPGQYYDQETGLNYNYFRDYDSSTGRYIQSDPIGLGGGINTYGYVAGNPVNAVDPFGLYKITWVSP